MADSTKYITKIKYSDAEYQIKDPNALNEVITSENSIVFKDGDDKYVKLTSSGGTISLSNVTYNQPSIDNNIRLDGAVVGSSSTHEIDHKATGSNYGDHVISGSITLTNCNTSKTPTVSASTTDSTVTVGAYDSSTSSYPISGTLKVLNNGSATLTISNIEGAEANPSTGDCETLSYTITVSDTYYTKIAYLISATEPSSVTTGGFSIGVDSSTDIQTGTTLTAFTSAVNSRTATADDSKLYIVIAASGVSGASANLADSFVISTDRSTVASSKLGGQCEYVGTINTYSVKKSYYVYSSTISVANGTTLYFRYLG